MNNTLKIILALLVIGVIVFFATKKSPVAVVPPGPDTNVAVITGCYVSHLGNDVYSLNIVSQQGESVSGTLVFKNFQKDSSAGTFIGTYKDGILLGNYSFRSEGMDSVMQVIFKRQGADFVRGYGPVDATGTVFTEISAIAYDQSQVFKVTTDACATTLTVTPSPSDSTIRMLAVGETKTINGVSIKFNKVTQDNRCPNDVVCIIAGSVTANVTLKLGTSSSTIDIVTDTAPRTFAGYKISITNVIPPAISTQHIEVKDYQVTFKVEKI